MALRARLFTYLMWGGHAAGNACPRKNGRCLCLSHVLCDEITSLTENFQLKSSKNRLDYITGNRNNVLRFRLEFALDTLSFYYGGK